MTTTNQIIPQKPETQNGPAALELASEIFAPLQTMQAAALDLYRRGLNVFPVPSAYEWNWYAATHPGNKLGKPPYLYKPLFTARLHVCGPDCQRREKKSGIPCLPKAATFEVLFDRCNLAVMMGRTSGNLFAFDCETPYALKSLRTELDRRGIDYWAYTSHRGGAVIMRLAEGEAANLPKGKCPLPDTEIWGHMRFMVFPPSTHPSGDFYRWVTPEPYYKIPFGEPPPLVSVKDLTDLGVELHKSGQWQEPDLYGLPEWTAKLSKNNRRILVTAWEKGIRNTMLTGPVYDVAALIEDGEVYYHDGLELLEEAGRRCKPPYGENQILQMLKSARRKPGLTKATEHHPSDHPRKNDPWQKALDWAQTWNWTGRTAQTDRAVFMACCERSRLDNSDTFRASTREVAELANCTRKTAQKALLRLSGRVKSTTPVILRLVSQDPKTGANCYRFTDFPDPENDHPICTPLITPCSNSGVLIEGRKNLIPQTNAEMDVFGRLGKVAWRVWVWLQKHPAPSKAAIARGIGAHASSVSYAVERLRKHGLAIWNSAEGLWYGEPKSEAQLERLAAVLDVLGKADKRKRTHQRERERRVNLALAQKRDKWRRAYLAWRKK